MAGTSMNDIKARMRSVSSTMQITKAMELVATSKLRRAKERLEASRPYATIADDALSSVLAAPDVRESPYLTPGKSGTLYVVIAGDRGLAGGYNSNVFRLTASLLTPADRVLPIGKKAQEYYRRRDIPLFTAGDYPIVAALGVGNCLTLSRRVTDAFLSGDVGRVVLVYTKFVSMLTVQPVTASLLPLSAPTEKTSATPLFDTEDTEDLLSRLVPDYLGGQLYAAVCESVASESGARRSSMSAANKNASEMIDSLMLRYNRARQAVITQEITEIVSGAEAL